MWFIHSCEQKSKIKLQCSIMPTLDIFVCYKMCAKVKGRSTFCSLGSCTSMLFPKDLDVLSDMSTVSLAF